MNLIDNFKQDLIKSLTKPLLIELNKKDINQFGQNGLEKAILYSQAVYDFKFKNKESTNLIFIDADKDNIHNYEEERIILLEEIINLTSQQIESHKKIKIIKAGIKSAFSYFTGPLINNVIGDYVNTGIDEVTGLLSDSIKDIIDLIGEEFNYSFSDKIISEITNKVNETLNNSASSILDEVSDKKLNLSKKATNELDTLSFQFSNELTSIELFSLIIQLFISIAINDEEKELSNNKLIFINNPHKLDENSLAILSLLFSFAKDLKEKNKHTGISVVYCYSDEDFQPYQELKNESYKISKKLLDDQRRFTQRYALLERPSSDIPNIAVKSSTFVGRFEELQILKNQFNKSKKDSTLKNIEIVKADPGIGKTKLVKKHIEQIRDSEKNGQRIIQLTLLNQVGHSSTNTGLASLKDSILKEAKRLEAIKTLEDTLIDKLKDLAKSKTISTIEGLLGVNNIIEIGTSIKDAYDIEKNTMQFLKKSNEYINNKTKKTKEQQFEDIIKAIIELKTLAYEGKAFKSFPLVLFIDDLQWIDEDSSEFILNYFTKNKYLDIHIIATLRASDATTALKLAQEDISLNPFKIPLLQQAGITTNKTIDNSEGVTKLISNTIDLKGLDEKNLTELISLTIDEKNKSEDKKEKDKILSQNIIKYVKNKDEEYVNTLFAIETINMLCDEKLYSSEHKYKDKDGNEIIKHIEYKLVIQNPLRFNEEIKDFQIALDETFKILDEKYKKAFEHINTDKKFENEQKFNLMAYAVLEERLHILNEYFGEYGNAAVNTLLFSSLIGTPFDSEIVKNILQELFNTDEDLLKPLKRYIKESNQCNLNDVHYEIIEEVYEILSRYIKFDRAYSYKHNLLEIFLDKQLDYRLDNILKKENIIEAKDKLFDLILTKIKKQEEEQGFYSKKLLSLNTYQYFNLIFFKKIEQNILKKALSNNKLIWLKKYIKNLKVTSKLFFLDNRVYETINLFKQSLEIIEEMYKKEPYVWSKDYAIALNSLSHIYFKLSHINESIKLTEKALEVRESLFFKKSNYFSEDYLVILNNLTYLYITNNQIDLAKNTSNKFLDIWEKLYKKTRISSKIKYYVDGLHKLAKIYEINDQISESIKLTERILEIAKKEYDEKPRLWVRKYVESLYKLSVLYLKNKLIVKAIILLENAITLCEIKYKQEPYDWVKYYIRIMNKLATAYLKNIQKEKAIELFEKVLEITEVLYKDNKSFWAKEYTFTLNNLGYIYFENNQKEKAIELFEKVLKITENLYMKNTKLWIKSYLNYLHNLAYSYKDNNQITKAIELEGQTLKIVEELYNKNPTVWANKYIDSFVNIATLYATNKDFKIALEYFKKYFERFNINNITDILSIKKFIYPFIKYYQVVVRLKDEATELDIYLKQQIKFLKDKFNEKYIDQIKTEYKGYIDFVEKSDNPLDKERLDIFKKLFIEENK